MKHIHKYFRKSNLVYLADCSGLIASCLCFIHCWILPLLLVSLPHLSEQNVWVHPVLCSAALLSTVPLLFQKTFGRQSGFFRFSAVFGIINMLIIFLIHNNLSVTAEMLLNTIGGLSLAYVHLCRLRMK